MGESIARTSSSSTLGPFALSYFPMTLLLLASLILGLYFVKLHLFFEPFLPQVLVQREMLALFAQSDCGFLCSRPIRPHLKVPSPVYPHWQVPSTYQHQAWEHVLDHRLESTENCFYVSKLLQINKTLSSSMFSPLHSPIERRIGVEVVKCMLNVALNKNLYI